MTLSNDLQGLAQLARELGAEPAYAQGGGGNLSIKTTPNHMVIKASGIELAKATAENAFVAVDPVRIAEGLGVCKTNDGYTTLVRDSITDRQNPNRRPSIEAGFHALLGKMVVHTHSVYANIITCSEQGEAWLRQHMPQSLWVPYATPGLDITLQLQKALQPDANVIFLQNHGLIVQANTVEAARQLHDSVNGKIRAKLKSLKDFDGFAQTTDGQQMLFPDQAVYLHHADLSSSTAARETLKAYHYIHHAITSLGFTPHYLPEAEAEKLLSMESEKYRQKMARS